MTSLVFDVTLSPFGAIADGVTDCTAAIQAAVTAACAVSNSVVVLPFGKVLVKAPIILTPGYQGRIAVRGIAGMTSEVIAGTNGMTVFHFDLSSGPNGGAANAAEFEALAFTTSTGVTAAAGVWVGYGIIPSSETNPGPVITNVSFPQGAGAGYVNGVVLNNSWHSRVTRVYGYGNATSYDTGAGAGSGAVVAYTGSSVNHTVSNVHSDFWRAAVSLTTTPGGTFQGFLIDSILAVQAPYGVFLDGTGGTGSGGTGAIQIRGVTVDNGNISTQSAGYAVYAKNVTSDIQVEGVYTTFNIKSFLNGLLFQGCSSVSVRGGRCYSSNANTPVGISFGGGGAHEVDGVDFFQFVNEVVFDAGTYNSRMSKCMSEKGFCTPLDQGRNNLVGDPRGFSAVIVFAGGSLTETIYVDISKASLGVKPDGVTAQVTSDQFYRAQPDWDDPKNSPRLYAIKYSRYDGLPVVKGNASRTTITVVPGGGAS